MAHNEQNAASAEDISAPAAAPRPSRPRPARPGLRTASLGSFRAGSPLPRMPSTTSRILRRLSTHQHYQTFPTAPPKTAGRCSYESRRSSPSPEGSTTHTPLPVRQLALLALLSLAEQTALNSISPYLPSMVASFPGIEPDEVGVYVGLLASAFALAQLTTNLFWGYLSDMVGRKPVMLVGTSLLCLCFCFFGFCTRYWHIILVHIAMGLLNGNAAVVPTCLGELTDRTNQSRAFTWLPVIYSLGSITGPALGGLLVGTVAADKYPFLAPNILGASLLASAVVVLWIWFDETLEDCDDHVELREKFEWLLCCLRRTKNKVKRTLGEDDDGADATEASEEQRLLGSDLEDDEHDDDPKDPSDSATWRQIFNRTTILVLITYLFFQLSNISFSSLYPLFAQAKPPTGRGLKADVIGISLSVAGVCTILFQLFVFPSFKSRLGNLGTYRGSLLGFAISMALIPWVGYRDGEPPFGVGSSKMWLYSELGVVLVIKNICSVGGLSSVMLLITNSAPSHASLGTVNGIAQTLSAAGRSFGPFAAGSLFSLSIHVQPKGEALAWGLFGGLALAGWALAYAISGEGLESTDDGYEPAEDNARSRDVQE